MGNTEALKARRKSKSEDISFLPDALDFVRLYWVISVCSLCVFGILNSLLWKMEQK